MIIPENTSIPNTTCTSVGQKEIVNNTGSGTPLVGYSKVMELKQELTQLPAYRSPSSGNWRIGVILSLKMASVVPTTN